MCAGAMWHSRQTPRTKAAIVGLSIKSDGGSQKPLKQYFEQALVNPETKMTCTYFLNFNFFYTFHQYTSLSG